jgi:hypothetical protein
MNLAVCFAGMSVLSRLFALALLVGPFLLVGCKSSSQLFVGVITDLPVKDRLTDATMEISRGEDVVFLNFAWDISGQPSLDFRLPGSINLYSTDGGSPVIGITLKGFKGGISPTVTRKAKLQLGSEENLFYRMALADACTVGKSPDCGDGMTCIEGVCGPETVDDKTLLPYQPERVGIDTPKQKGMLECDSGTAYIATGTCSTGCQVIPVNPVGCSADEFCQEGTCYRRGLSLTP